MTQRFKDLYKEHITKEQVKDILGKYFDDSQKFKYEYIEQGWENINLVIFLRETKYILRIYNEKQFRRIKRDEDHVLYELEFIDYLYENKIPVPKIIKNKEGCLFSKAEINGEIFFVALFSFIEGNEVKRMNLEKISEVAMWQGKIHSLTKKYNNKRIRHNEGPLDFYKWWDDAKTKNQRVKNKELSRGYEKIMEKVREKINPETVKGYERLLVHADVHGENIRFKKDKMVGIFDFDDCRDSVVSEDIGTFLEVCLREGSLKSLTARASQYFSSYKRHNNITNQEIVLSLYYVLEKKYQIRYFQLYHLEKEGKLTAEVIEKNKKILDLYEPISKLIKLVESGEVDL